MSIESEFGIRHIQAILIFFCYYSTVCIKPSLNMLILDMSQMTNDSNTLTFDWDKRVIGLINSSGFWGDMIVQILVCPLVYKYGAKPFVIINLLFTGIIELMLPSLAQWADWKGMCIGCALQGLSGGLMYPSMQTLIGKWAPYDERTRIGIFIYSGLYISFIISYSFTPWISTNYGWQRGFYFYGIQSLACLVLWIKFGSSSPAEHKTIPNEERQYIQSSLEQTTLKIPKAPWKSIVTSRPYLVLLIAHIGTVFSFTIVTLEIAQYFNFAVGFDLQDSGLYTSLSYTIALICSLVGSWLCDFALNKKYCSLTVIRKLANTIGTWGPAIFLAAITFIPITYTTSIIFCAIIISGLDSINSCGFVLNYVDLSPNYAGILMSISIFISDIFSMMAPQLSGYVVDDVTDITKWRLVFFITAAIYFLGNLLFVIFGSAETQNWNNISDEEDKDNADTREIPEESKLKTDLG